MIFSKRDPQTSSPRHRRSRPYSFRRRVQNGITDLDTQVANILRRAKTPVILCANKTDQNEDRYGAAEFYALGLGEPYCISAASGSGTGDLLDLILEKMPADRIDEGDADIPRFSVVGRPQCPAKARSSCLPSAKTAHIVTDIAGTTRDSILTEIRQVRFRLLPRRHSRYPQEEQSNRRSGVLQRDAFHSCH